MTNTTTSRAEIEFIVDVFAYKLERYQRKSIVDAVMVKIEDIIDEMVKEKVMMMSRMNKRMMMEEDNIK